MRCGTLKLPVCRFKTPPCVHSKRPRVYRQQRFERTHGDVLNLHTEGGGEAGVITVSSAYPNLPGYHVLQRFNTETLGSFPFSSLRIGREQHVPDSSNHSLYLIKLFSYSNLEGNFGGNQLPNGSICLSSSTPPRPSRQHTTQHQHITTSHTTHGDRHRETEKAEEEREKEPQPFSSLLHHLPGADMSCIHTYTLYTHRYTHTHKHEHIHIYMYMLS